VPICLRIGTPSSAVSQTRLWLAFSLRRRCGKLNVERFEQLVLSRMMTLCEPQHALWYPPRSLLLRAQRPKLRRNDMVFSVDSGGRAGKGRRPAAALICALPEELRAEGKRPYGEIIERGPCQRAVLLSASIIPTSRWSQTFGLGRGHGRPARHDQETRAGRTCSQFLQRSKS